MAAPRVPIRTDLKQRFAWSTSDNIGEGSYGVVMVCRDLRTRKRYALKFVRNSSSHEHAAFVNEVETLR